jgi:hypothetical protein
MAKLDDDMDEEGTDDGIPQPSAPPPGASSTCPDARTRALVLILFLLVYGTACALPAFYMTGQVSMWRGAHLMTLGVLALRLGQLGWLANIAALVALRAAMAGHRLHTALSSVLAVLLGLHSLKLLQHEVSIGPGDFNVVRLFAFGPGFYVWFVAMLIPLICSEWLALLSRRQGG